jgi:hypothetical protein
MSNVRLHPYEGSEPFCGHCQLPKKNAAHQPNNTTLITATYPDGTSEEFWTVEFTKAQLSKALNDLVTEAVLVGDCDYCATTYDTSSRIDHCADCGTCWEHCQDKEQHVAGTLLEET